jgi:uncharacterized membrane protein YqjE
MASPRPAAAEAPSRGLFASLRRLVSTFVTTLHSRAELLGHEFERERIRLTRLALLGAAALLFLVFGLLMATVFVIVLFWDSQRLVAIGFLTVVYFAIGGGIALFAKQEASRAGRPFSATIEQLRQDREHLTRR